MIRFYNSGELRRAQRSFIFSMRYRRFTHSLSVCYLRNYRYKFSYKDDAIKHFVTCAKENKFHDNKALLGGIFNVLLEKTDKTNMRTEVWQ